MAGPRIAIMHYSCQPVIGGVETIIEEHATWFADAGYRTKIIVGKGEVFDRRIPVKVVPEIASRGGPLSRELHMLAGGQVPHSFGRAVRQVEKKLAPLLRDVDVCMMHNIMTMHFNLILTAAMANIMARRKNTRFVAWTHDMTFTDPVYEHHQHWRYPWSCLQKPQEGCSYCVISGQRQQEMKDLFRLPRRALPVIPDGIDLPALMGLTPPMTGLFRSENLANIDIVALTPARILKRKNLGLGMEIIGALRDSGKSVRWIVTGAPDPHNPESMNYFKLLVALRKKLMLRDEVIFLCERMGRLSRRDLRGLYAMSDMLLFPSEREGFGLPVLEAGLRGLLCVISDIPALRELADRNAIFIQLGEPVNRVAREIIRSMSVRQEFAFRKKVMQNYAWKVVFEKKVLPVVASPDSVWKSR